MAGYGRDTGDVYDDARSADLQGFDGFWVPSQPAPAPAPGHHPVPGWQIGQRVQKHGQQGTIVDLHGTAVVSVLLAN